MASIPPGYQDDSSIEEGGVQSWQGSAITTLVAVLQNDGLYYGQ